MRLSIYYFFQHMSQLVIKQNKISQASVFINFRNKMNKYKDELEST